MLKVDCVYYSVTRIDERIVGWRISNAHGLLAVPIVLIVCCVR